jgi:hypothetical protein
LHALWDNPDANVAKGFPEASCMQFQSDLTNGNRLSSIDTLDNFSEVLVGTGIVITGGNLLAVFRGSKFNR